MASTMGNGAGSTAGSWRLRSLNHGFTPTVDALRFGCRMVATGLCHLKYIILLPMPP
jgi:hypothetical protein